MEKDLIFVGETGITDTTASRIADFAKLAYTELETELSSIKFYGEKIESIDGSNSKDLSYGIKSVDDIPSKIERIGNLKSLCAWLREAIQAHQNLINESKRINIHDYAKKMGLEMPKCPEKESSMTTDDVLALFDIKKRNRYYTLEAHAATLGQFIHKDGAIDKARKNLYDKINNPRKITGSGHDTIIYSYEPSVSNEDVEKLFYTLQQKHADYQKELNSLKSEIKSRIANDDIDKSKAYDVAYKEYSSKEQKIFNEFRVWLQEEQKRVQALKIVIPNSLKEIYDEVSQFGK